MIDEGKLQQYVKKNPSQVNTLDLREIRVSHARVNSTSRKADENATRLKMRHIQDWRISNKVDYANLIGTETLEEGKTEICFSVADLASVYQPHNDAIVILALIGMYKVRRVLVDTGSSISVIFYGAYTSMSLNESQVEPDDNPIIGFSGETMTAIGRCFPTSYQGRGEEGPPTIEELVEVQIGDQKEHTTFISAELPLGESESLITFLKENKDVFAWSLKDMPGIDPSIACHRLNIDEGFKPVMQKPRKMAPERKEKVGEEIEKMLEARIIKPVRYPKWLENIVAVPKKNGKIRVCIDFTNLNKACPSDPYPMPRIVDLVDST
ncbi:uncharacterized protein LOC113326292 [Papaver somniferum]|uniref:uncharacterized protein LOC113326292 n=1 Tax=Papaver somniferum TaxID=3469 RepID=UPI000E70565F|nr:uncharacterized protein LOC113326292 [Papaver somniferum]